MSDYKLHSQIKMSPNCSVVQGSKLSSVLYNIYTNEIPLLYKLVNDKTYETLTFENLYKITNIEHNTINFVDDSTSIITFKTGNNIKLYLESYFKLLLSFYNANHFKINPDKTNLLLINIYTKDFTFWAGNYLIKTKKVIKILGIFIRRDLKLDTQVGKVCSELHNRIINIRNITKLSTVKARLNFLNAFIIGKLIYALPLYVGLPQTLLNKLHKVIMTTARTAIGSYCYKKSISYILDNCKLLSIKDKNNINKSILNFFHPKPSCDKCLKFRQLHIPKMKMLENNLFHNGHIYTMSYLRI